MRPRFYVYRQPVVGWWVRRVRRTAAFGVGVEFALGRVRGALLARDSLAVDPRTRRT